MRRVTFLEGEKGYVRWGKTKRQASRRVSKVLKKGLSRKSKTRTSYKLLLTRTLRRSVVCLRRGTRLARFNAGCGFARQWGRCRCSTVSLAAGEEQQRAGGFALARLVVEMAQATESCPEHRVCAGVREE